MDFAENYSFVVQDAVQGQHWNNSQTTLHPFAVYYRECGDVKCLSVCIVSDHLQHNTNVVHAFIAKVVSYLKCHMSIEQILYFTDGAASQYKNYKNLTNLCYHMKDFQVNAEWHFFATSHGKSPCDGIGGTVKRLVARASLQATTTGQILTPKDLHAWASEHILGITFFYVGSEEIKQHELIYALEDRYMAVKTIPGTRSHHAFVPNPDGTLQMKRVSSDAIYSVVHLGLGVADKTADCVNNSDAYQPGQYVACVYDSNWYLGNIIERSDTNHDVLVNFMQKQESNRLSWPLHQDSCWIPFLHILCMVSVPEMVSASARQYQISDNEYERIEHQFHNRKQ